MSCPEDQVQVCFVCLGNICRSPTGEGVLKKLLQVAGLSSQVSVESAGTAAYHVGEPADRRSFACAQARGYVLDGVSRKFVSSDFSRFDYVLAMDDDNLKSLRNLRQGVESPRGQLSLMRAFDVSAPAGAVVGDPYYGGEDGFDEVVSQCERACLGGGSNLTLQEVAFVILEKCETRYRT